MTIRPKHWNQIIARPPQTHLLQTQQWGEIKSQYGWDPTYRLWGQEDDPDAAALVLERRIPIVGLSALLRVMYVPKGPLLRDWGDEALRARVLDDLQNLARERGAIFLKLDPDVPLGTGVPGKADAEENPLGERVRQELQQRGWQFSPDQIQFRNTMLVDLRPSEEEILAGMKSKTRYNIRYAGRNGVTVRRGGKADFDLLYRMYAETSSRGGFVIRSRDYYDTVWETFLDADMLDPLIAEVEGETVGGLMLFHFGERAYYLHGMSRTRHRNTMFNYLLQWEAICRSKRAGCTVYDMWGAPDVFDKSDDMWGVYRFKRGFNSTALRTLGAYDYPVRPLLYRLYTRVLPQILDWMRRRGKARTKRIHEEHKGHE